MATPESAPEARRRSPGWVRALESRNLHALAFRLRWEYQDRGLSGPQEWLLDACISELEYRRRRALRCHSWSVCSCELCVPATDQVVGLEGYEEGN